MKEGKWNELKLLEKIALVSQKLKLNHVQNAMGIVGKLW